MTTKRCYTLKNLRTNVIILLAFNLINLLYFSNICAEDLPDSRKSNWFWTRPVPTGNMLYSLHFTDALTGYAAGSLGTIIKTTDGGKSWSTNASNTLQDLSEIYFINKYEGFSVGSSGTILKTNDCGKLWSAVASGTSGYLHDIIFTGRSTGYCAGLNGIILKSKDKGNSWSKLVTGTSAPLFCLDFLNGNTGAAGGYNIIIKTTDGGKSWDNQDLDYAKVGAVAGICFLNNQTIYAAGNVAGGAFCKTTDGGFSWKINSLGLPNVFDGSVDLVRSMSFLNSKYGYIVTDFGTILKTTDGGNSWLRDSSFRPSYTKLSVMYDIQITDSSHINISGSGGTVIRTSNAGLNWFSEAGNKNSLRGCFFTDSYSGYAVGEKGEILKTKDGGIRWSVLNRFTTKFLNSVYFVNTNTGFAAGDSGTIFKTSDGGSSWIDQTNYRRYNINCIFFTNELSGIAAGGNPENERAFIYKTDDGGNSWYEVYDSLSLGVLNSVDFYSESGGIAVGKNGNVLYSYDAGESWMTDNISPVNLYSVSFQNNINGLISGANGIIYKTTDGGNSWNTIVSGYFIKLNAVKYRDHNFAASAGEKGTVLYSYNGGYNWSSEIRITYNDFYALDIINGNKAAAFGEYGSIICSDINKSMLITKISGSKSEEDHKLSQNFPNPFNPVTNLKFEISTSEFVSLKIYNITGKEVSVLVNEFKPAGIYEINFDGRDLSGGVYFYSLYLNNKRSETRRMVLLK
ncbi:MAG TPA: YCF48-related protein [Ignavibacteria bacterium]|nr:YCF48-related protein [Ignavibacteria bacterium]